MSFVSSQVVRKITQELTDLVNNPPEGVKVIVNDEDISDVTVLLRGPEDTPFQGGVFKIKLKLGQDFPSAPPKGAFVTKIFHPNVSIKGEICVNTLKKDWQPEMGIRHVLLTIKCLLINPNPESALNEEAGRLLIEKYEDYFKHAKLMTSVHGTKLKWEDSPSSNEATADTASATPSSTTHNDDVSGEEDEKCKENSVPARSASSSTMAATKTAKPATAAASSTAAAVPKANSAAALKQKKSLKRL